MRQTAEYLQEMIAQTKLLAVDHTKGVKTRPNVIIGGNVQIAGVQMPAARSEATRAMTSFKYFLDHAAPATWLEIVIALTSGTPHRLSPLLPLPYIQRSRQPPCAPSIRESERAF